ncbi:unnamed protein product [Chironomus riparius]|uniref:Dystroglycan 1 n=1 Tax=Chironomus riparius TaxID=315576 RepID=A0A9P0NF93_9DIPT|nr:unnamed protein product [Chironomus riparius]
MIFKRRFNATFIVLLFSTMVASERRGEEYKVNVDDLQVVYSDPPETVITPPSRYLYSKEIAQCPSGESKMMLTLLLQSHKWSDVGEKKREKAIKKMSRFFHVPVNYIKVDDVHTPEMLEMLKHSINKSNNLLNTKETVGRIEFPIGCGDKLFSSSKSVAHKINEYVKSKKLQELSGLPFHWWNIWSKHLKSRVQRTRRQADGSGEGEGDDYEDYEETDQDLEENEDENTQDTLPDNVQSYNNQVTPSTTSTLAHGSEKKSEEESNYDDEYDDEDANHDDDTYEESLPTEKPTTSFRTTVAARTTSGNELRTPPPLIVTPQDDDDDDDQETEIDESIKQLLSSSSLPPTTTTQIPTTTTRTTTLPSTTLPITTTTVQIVEFTSEASENNAELPDANEPTDYDYPENQKPYVAKRLNKLQATSGKTFTHKIEGVFNDQEDGTKLNIELLDKNNDTISSNSWIRYNPKTKELYGLPLENDVSKHEFKLRATDNNSEHVDEIVDITVHQHKTLRSVNHEIYIQVTIEKDYDSIIDWEIRLIRGIIEALDDKSVESIVVRDVKPNKHNKNLYTFVYSNDTLPKDTCPKAELDKLMLRLTKKALSDVLQPEITVRNVERDLINSCAEVNTPRPPPSPPNTKNFPPTVRNAIDKITATIGQLLVFVVPKDTFYDPEDLTELKLTLLNEDRSPIDPSNWLQFDAKNQEFYGVPGVHDKSQQYVLVAEDKNGLTTNDALVVDVHNTHFKSDYSAAFEYQLEIGMEQFQNPSMKRKFIERLQQYFHDSTTDSIVIKSVKKLQYLGRTAVVVQNTTLHHPKTCPSQDILTLRDRLVRQDGSVKSSVKEAIGNEFNVQKITVSPTGKCTLGDTSHHHEIETGHVDRPDEKETPIINQEVLITYVLPSAIILLMLLIALLIACLLYKRRNTGKMELGDEEERKSFRTKGIPVIFQDELDEKPEILTKSPVILKDEKPPLLPQYNGMSQDGEDENVDQYIPPQPLLMGSRESRGKSPVTPSYRKPPPYVSP